MCGAVQCNRKRDGSQWPLIIEEKKGTHPTTMTAHLTYKNTSKIFSFNCPTDSICLAFPFRSNDQVPSEPAVQESMQSNCKGEGGGGFTEFKHCKATGSTSAHKCHIPCAATSQTSAFRGSCCSTELVALVAASVAMFLLHSSTSTQVFFLLWPPADSILLLLPSAVRRGL